MIEPGRGIIVGVLGQWASGKSTAARTLVGYLGGEGKVVFINDQHLVARQVVNHILELEPFKVVSRTEDDGRQRLEGDHATIWLHPEEDLRTVDLSTLSFRVSDYTMPLWLNSARAELAHQIRDRSAEGKPIVVEAGFGENPSDHTIADLFLGLKGAGIEPKQLRWIIVEASYDRRAERNKERRFGVPVEVFARYAAAGGDLAPDDQKRLEEQGTIIQRVSNDHDDVERFGADIIAAFEGMFGGAFPASTVGGKREPA